PDQVGLPQAEAPEVEAEVPEPGQVEFAADLGAADGLPARAAGEALAERHVDLRRDTRGQLTLSDLLANIPGEADTAPPSSGSTLARGWRAFPWSGRVASGYFLVVRSRHSAWGL